ncbi:MAG TPA: ABC transporter substrate-binding protein [Alphaproteobacteria bacterium]
MHCFLHGYSRRALIGAIAGVVGLALAGQPSAQQASGKPIRIGQTLALTGPLGQTGVVHKTVGDIFIANLNKSGGLLGRPVEWIVIDDQSKPDVARTLYERLITVDKVDLIMGPYATANILAAIAVAQRYKKLIIHNTMGIPNLATYEWQFNALLISAEPQKTVPALVYDAYASVKPLKSITVVTSKFPSAKFNSDGAREVAKARGMDVKDYMEYDFGTREYGSIAARIKAADADLLWMGALGVDGNLLVEAMGKLDYKPRNALYLYPSPSIANVPGAENGLSQTNLENVRPYLDNPTIAKFAKEFHEKAVAANLPYKEIDSQTGFALQSWEVLTAAIRATKSLDDKTLAEWLKKADIDTSLGKRNFRGKFNTNDHEATHIRQIQNKEFVIVWPKAVATPGKKIVVH